MPIDMHRKVSPSEMRVKRGALDMVSKTGNFGQVVLLLVEKVKPESFVIFGGMGMSGVKKR